MGSLHNDLASWAGKARANGHDTIELDVKTAEDISLLLMHNAQEIDSLKDRLRKEQAINMRMRW